MINGLGSGLTSIVSELGNIARGEATAPKAGTGGSFSDLFQSAMGSVNSMQTSADQQIADLLQGKGNVDVSKVTTSVEKADIAFQLMMQVRNKVVSAYQDMEKMQF